MRYGNWTETRMRLQQVNASSMDNYVPFKAIFTYYGVFPMPDLRHSGYSWTVVWQMHTTVMSVTGFLQAIIAFFLLLCGGYWRRRCCGQSYIHNSKSIPTLLFFIMSHGVLLSGSCFLISGFVKPKGWYSNIYSRLSQHLEVLSYASLLAAYGCLLHRFLKVAKIKLAFGKILDIYSISGILAVSYIVFVCEEISVYRQRNLKYILLIPQGLFIITGLAVCSTFIYKGFTITQFLKEAHTLFCEITNYKKLKRNSSRTGKKRELALCHLIQMNRQPSSYGLQDHHVDNESETSTSYRREGRTNHIVHNGRYPDTAMLSSDAAINDWSDLESVWSDDKDDIMETPTTGIVSLEEQSFEEPFALTQGGEASHSNFDAGVSTIASAYADSANNAALQSENTNLHDTVICEETLHEDSLSSQRESDEGYMADSENYSPAQINSRFKRPMLITNRTYSSQHGITSDEGKTPKPVPRLNDRLGLHSVKHGHRLFRILKLTYFTTLCLFITCVFQLYAVFGVYGVLSTHQTVSPWPWLAFQVVLRTSDFMVSLTILYSIYRLNARHGHASKHRSISRRINVVHGVSQNEMPGRNIESSCDPSQNEMRLTIDDAAGTFGDASLVMQCSQV